MVFFLLKCLDPRTKMGRRPLLGPTENIAAILWFFLFRIRLDGEHTQLRGFCSFRVRLLSRVAQVDPRCRIRASPSTLT
jgi:hypothetical protein